MMGPAIGQMDIAMMADLAYILGLRGKDSTGVLQGFVHKKQSQYRVVKSTHEVGFFLWWNRNMEKEGGDVNLLNDITDNFMAIHCRHATKGSMTKANAHPFEKSNIIGMHNGTLLDRKYDHEEKTDSEMMFDDINDRDIKTVLGEMQQKSAYAIVQFDKRTNKFNFVRNDERTLYYAINQDRSVFYWASEARMIWFAANRNCVNIDKIKLFESGKIYSFGPSDVRKKDEPLWEFSTVTKDPVIHTLEDRMKFLPRAHGHNIVPITKGKTSKKVRNGRKVVTFDPEVCTMCRKDLNMFEQWRGHEYEKGKFLCAICDEKLTIQARKTDDNNDEKVLH